MKPQSTAAFVRPNNEAKSHIGREIVQPIVKVRRKRKSMLDQIVQTASRDKIIDMDVIYIRFVPSLVRKIASPTSPMLLREHNAIIDACEFPIRNSGEFGRERRDTRRTARQQTSHLRIHSHR